MDNNNPAPTPPVPAAVQPTPVQAPVTPEPNLPITPDNKLGGDNKMMLWLVVGLVAVALVAGGFYLYMKQKAPQVPNNVSQTVQPLDTLESDLKKVEAESEDSLSSIDQDLQSL